jgi:glycine hydroxymethyltransferase
MSMNSIQHRTWEKGATLLQAPSHLEQLLRHGCERLREEDEVLHGLLEKEFARQQCSLNLVASSSTIDPTTHVCQASVAANVTAEGYPGRRYQGGCEVVDQIEALAIERAKHAFGCDFANVQPHSASIANELIMLRLFNPGDVILGMRLDAGGHLTHGAPASLSGSRFKAIGYGVTAAGFIDYDQVRDLARNHRPKLIVCGTTAYPREIDFRLFREIAEEFGSLLLADITHVAGLVAAKLHPDPVPHAHITTTCTHKQLYGPRGGLILMGPDRTRIWKQDRTLEQEVQQGVFPYMQGAPIPNVIAAKARAFHRLTTTWFHELALRIKANASDLAAGLVKLGCQVISGGTDTHIVVVDVVASYGVTGIIAQKALERCRISVNKNSIPQDTKPVGIASGIRLGSNNTALRGFGSAEMEHCAHMIDRILRAVTVRNERDFELSESLVAEMQDQVGELCRHYGVAGYPEVLTLP